MAKPLEGIRVIELANFIAGPLCGTLLADMGADVVKIEPPQGDMGRATPPIRNGESVSFTALNRNKRSSVLDLKRPGAQEIMRRLAAKSDVFVEANRPGALEKMGLGAEHLKAVNSKIIYTLGVGLRPDRTGPPARRRQPDHRGVLRPAVGDRRARSDAGAARRADRRCVRRAVCDLCDAGGVPSARVGPAKAASPTYRWSKPRSPRPPGRPPNILETGQVPQPMGNKHRLTAPYQLFETSDRRYIAIGTPNNMLFEKFMQVVGLEQHLSDPRFATYAQRKANEAPLLALVEPAIRAHAFRASSKPS